ncbi:hypothetical protein DFJ73DRAFT_214977 [Zopfochytrium polystomum]|nr:hypothetical protein DFJ73DRAFT_214977 [Zopfochytrium polystomum]
MRTLEISVEKMMEKIAEKAVMTFLDLTKNLFEDDSTAMVFLIPLSNVVSALQKLNHEDRVLRITLHLLLSRVLTCYIEKYSKKQEKGDPWPSAEALAKYCKDAPEQALKHLESAMKLIKDRPALRYLLFQVTKVYLKNLSVQPSNKSTKFENLLKEESSLRVFIQLSIMENGQINQSDAKGLLSEVEKLCETCGSAEETLSILVDFAEQCIRQGLTDIAKRFLDKSMLMNGSTQLCHRRQLVQLQLELERIRASASLVAESDAQHAFMSAAAALMKALDLDCDSAIIHATCLQMFSAFISWKEANKFHPQWFTATVKSIADALTQRPGLEESKRCVIEYELAKCYEEQNVFSLAAAHAKKALVFCSQAELQGPIEIMIQKLSTKAKAFEGKLAPELQALSLVDQAKSVSQSGVALKLLENAIRTIIPDHEFISPAAAAESSDPVQALLGIEYHLTFDNIVLGSSKVKQLILVALNDIMIHSRQLALRVETKGNSNLRRLWKAAWDCSSYILCEAWVGVTVEKALLRIQAEANTIRGEALTFFLRVSDCTAEAETERGAEELQRKEAAILSSISQSISICQQISDVSMLESNASLLTGHYFETPDALKQSAAGACVDVFQKLYEAMASTGLKSSDLFLQVCLGYVQALKDLHDVAAPSTTPGDDRSKAKGSVAKAAPAKAAPGKDRENLKLAEEVFTVAFASPSNRYDLKLALFELRSTFRGAAGSPASESDPLLKLFATLEAMDSQKKPTREDLDSAVAELSRSAGKLPNELAITLWLKLIRFCNLAEQYLLAFSCIRALFGRIPSDLPAKAAAKKCNTDAGVLMECELLYGRIIFSLMTQKTPYGEYQVMRSDALLHFCNAIEYGSLSSSSMAQIETCLLLFRDVSAGSKLSQLGENYALFLERIIRSLQGCNFMSTARSEEFVNALIFLSDRCLEYFYFKRNFQAGTRLLDRLFRILPPAYHRMLWEKKIQILSDSGMQITSTVLGEASIEVQSNLWYKLALKSNGNQHRRSHLENVLQLVRLPGFELKFIEFGLEFVKWLLTETDELDKAKNLLSEVKVTLNTARSHSVNDQISQLKVLCIELDISETRLAKLSFVEKASAFLTQIIEGIFLTAQPSDSSTRSGHSSAKKSKDKEQPVEAEPCTMPARDKWVDFEWPQSVKASFQSTTDPRYLSAARSSEIRSVVSCTLRIILAHFELGRFPESMALISLLEFLSEICSADGVPMESLRHLCATLFSHAAIKIGSWTRAVAKLFSGSPPQNLSVKDTERVLCDIGVPVNTLSFSLQKSKILYDRSDYSQALDALALSFDSAEDSDLLSKIESAFLLDLLTETLEKTKSAVQIAKLGGVLCRNILPRYAGKLRKSFEHTHRSELKSIYLSALEGTHLSIPSKAVLHEELFYLAKAENTNESALGHFKLAVEYYKESESFASVVPITIDLAKFYLQEIPHYAPITERKHQEAALAAARVLQECNQNIQGLISNGTSFDPDLWKSLKMCTWRSR